MQKHLENYEAKLYSEQILDGEVDSFEISEDSRNGNFDQEVEKLTNGSHFEFENEFNSDTISDN